MAFVKFLKHDSGLITQQGSSDSLELLNVNVLGDLTVSGSEIIVGSTTFRGHVNIGDDASDLVTITSSGTTLTTDGTMTLGGSLTAEGITDNTLTASRLLATDGSKGLESVGDLTSWVAGTVNRVTVTDDADGSITLSGPQDIHSAATPTFADLTVSNLTASRLTATDGASGLASVANLANWVAGTANRVTVTDDADGTITLSAPQDLHSGATPTFAGMTSTDDITFSADKGIKATGDADMRITMGDDVGVNKIAFYDDTGSEVAWIDSNGNASFAGDVNISGSVSGTTDHGNLIGLDDDDHTQYILHSLADAANDFLIASGDNTFVKKTLAETGAILEGDIDHDNLVGYVANEHIDHSGVSVLAGTLLTGGGTIDANVTLNVDEASIDHGSIAGLGDDDHTQYSLADGTRAFTGTVAGVTPVADADLTTKGYVDGELTTLSGALVGEMITDHGNLTGLSDDDHSQYILVDGSRAFTGNVKANASGTLDIGSSGTPFANLYADDVYVKGTSLHIGDTVELTEVSSDLNVNTDLRLSGTSPSLIGTATNAGPTSFIIQLGQNTKSATENLYIKDHAGVTHFMFGCDRTDVDNTAFYHYGDTINFGGDVDSRIYQPYPTRKLTFETVGTTAQGTYWSFYNSGQGGDRVTINPDGDIDAYGDVTVSGYVGWDIVQLSEYNNLDLQINSDIRLTASFPTFYIPSGSDDIVFKASPNGGFEWQNSAAATAMTLSNAGAISAYGDLSFIGSDYGINSASNNNLPIKIGDSAGANKVIFETWAATEVASIDSDGDADFHGNVTVSGYVGWDSVQLSEYNNADLEINSDIRLTAVDPTIFATGTTSDLIFKVNGTGKGNQFFEFRNNADELLLSIEADTIATGGGRIESYTDSFRFNHADDSGLIVEGSSNLYLMLGTDDGSSAVNFRDDNGVVVAWVDSNGNASFNTISGAIIEDSSVDHGGLSGLSDDDHTQYSLVDGTRAFSSTVGGVTPAADADLATKGYVDSIAGEPATMTVASGTTTAIGSVMYVSANDTVDEADKDDSSATKVIGLAQSIVVGDGALTVGVQSDGILEGALGAATAGDRYYLGDDGAVSSSPPAAVGDYVLMIGVAVNATDLFIKIGDAILL